jgi:hypothetical protein
MDLESLFTAAGVPRTAYSIGSDDNEAYCLVEEPDGWHVYYSERGHRNNERIFAQEAVAIAEMWSTVMNDSTVQEVLLDRSVADGGSSLNGAATANRP